MTSPRVEDVWPLAPLQEGLLFHAGYDADNPRDGYVGQRVLDIEGSLDPDALRASWQALLDRHATLRAGLQHRASGEPVQVIAKQVALPWRYLDLSASTDAAAEADRLAEEDRRRFDLTVPPLLRVLLIRRAPTQFQMVVTMHHILMDGWPLPVLFRELCTLCDNIEVLDEREQAQVVREGNDTAQPYPDASLPALFERQVVRDARRVAVVSRDGSLTYGELNERANRLAYRLMALGIGPESMVGVLMERSADLVVALLGVLKAGGAYVPLDARHPVPWLRTVAAEVGLSAVLVDDANAGHPVLATGALIPVEVVPVTSEALASGPGAEDPEVGLSPSNAAYVMHTSGSTGVPKCVAITHGNVVSFCLDRAWRPEVLERVLMQANHAFDASTYQLWVPLLRGGRVVIAPPGVPIGLPMERRG